MLGAGGELQGRGRARERTQERSSDRLHRRGARCKHAPIVSPWALGQEVVPGAVWPRVEARLGQTGGPGGRNG